MARAAEPTPTGDVRIVPTGDEHVAGYNAVLTIVARERRWFGLVDGPPLEVSERFVRAARAEGGVHVVALDALGRVVGWCDVARLEREGFRHGGRLGIGLLAEHRGRGLGQRLMETAIAAAWARGLERIELEVYASNTRAIALYERLGFEAEGVKRRALKLDGRYDDDLLMALLAPPDPTHALPGGAGDHASRPSPDDRRDA